MTEITLEDAAKFPTLRLASRSIGAEHTYHGGANELHAMLPPDMTHPAIGFLVVEMPEYSYRNPSKCYRFDSLDEAYTEYARAVPAEPPVAGTETCPHCLVEFREGWRCPNCSDCSGP